MPEQLSQIDELFRYASMQEEQNVVVGDWETMRKKLFEKPRRRNRMLGFFIISSFCLITTLVCAYYLFPDIKKTLFNKKNTSNQINSNLITEKKEAVSYNQKQTEPEATGDTSKLQKKEGVNNNKYNPLYKVQVGAFVNSPAENFYASLPNVTTEYSGGFHKYYAGEYDNLADAQKRMQEVKALGFNEVFITSPSGIENNSTISYFGSVAQTMTNPVTAENTSTSSQKENTEKIIYQTAAEDNTIQNTSADGSIRKEESNDSIVLDSGNTSKQQEVIQVQTKADTLMIKEEYKKYGVGLSWSYNLNKFRIDENTNDGSTLMGTSSDLLQGPENFSFTIGMQFIYRFTKNISVETGLLYSQKKRLDIDDLQNGNNKYEFHYNGKYIDIPVRARVYLINKPLKIFVTSGAFASLNFPLKNKGYFKFTNIDDTTYSEKVSMEPASTGISFQFGAGIDYILQNRWRLYFSPIYSYSFSPVLKHPTYNNEPVKHYVNSFNLTIGCYYDF